MSIRYLLSPLLLCCLLTAVEATAQTKPPPKRPPVPRWLPRPPEQPVHPRRPVRQPVRLAYQPRGYRNVFTANVPALILIGRNGCIAGGAEYERFLDQKGHFSAAVSGYGFMTAGFDLPTSIAGAQIMPAFLYHPAGNTKLIDYSAGIAVSAGYMKTDYSDRDGFIRSTSRRAGFGAALGQLNLALHHTKAFVFGVHLSGGALFERGQDVKPVLQAGIKLGGRF